MPSASNEVEHLTETYCVRVLQIFRRDVNTYLVFSEEELWQQIIRPVTRWFIVLIRLAQM